MLLPASILKYTYSTSTSDPDGDQVYYWFDWGDDTNSGWIGPYDSGTLCESSHIWRSTGSYEIRVKAKDDKGAQSEWSDFLAISMPKNWILFYLLFKGFFIDVLEGYILDM